jgi:hypothetical protein
MQSVSLMGERCCGRSIRRTRLRCNAMLSVLTFWEPQAMTTRRTHTVSNATVTLIASAMAIVLCAAPAGALTIYSDADWGVGPSDPCPNSDAQEAAWNAAASAYGTVHLIDFENQALGAFSLRSLGANATVSSFNTDPDGGGVSSTLYAPVATGFNTTPGGANFLRFVPCYDVATSQVVFSFDKPVHAFGVYLSGMGTAAENLHVLFSSGAVNGLHLGGDTTGGVQYLGFVFGNRPVSSVTFQFDDVAHPRDIIGIDDVAFVAPEPATALLFAIGALALRPSRRLDH